ncbi:hypothetical protein H0X06_05715 [Candidatus Dependentiae bacterium]|nr:hypothetical protein [Candidatus Dependentiae bacterium]
MKRYVVASLLCGSFVFGSLNCVNVNEGELLTAIRDNDEEKVQLLLLETPNFERESKTRLLVASSTSVEEWQKSVSLFGTGRDSLALASGAAIALWGALKVYSTYKALSSLAKPKYEIVDELKADAKVVAKKKIRTKQAYEFGVDGLLISGLGYHLLKRGYNCVSALKSLKKAKRIQCLIEKAPYVIVAK